MRSRSLAPELPLSDLPGKRRTSGSHPQTTSKGAAATSAGAVLFARSGSAIKPAGAGIRGATGNNTPWPLTGTARTGWVWSSLILLLSIADALFTLTLLQHGASEANPLMAPLVTGSGHGFAFWKVGLTTTGVCGAGAFVKVPPFRPGARGGAAIRGAGPVRGPGHLRMGTAAQDWGAAGSSSFLIRSPSIKLAPVTSRPSRIHESTARFERRG